MSEQLVEILRKRAAASGIANAGPEIAMCAKLLAAALKALREELEDLRQEDGDDIVSKAFAYGVNTALRDVRNALRKCGLDPAEAEREGKTTQTNIPNPGEFYGRS